MGRHTMINPKTGRRIYKTGQLGQSILKKKGKKLPAKTTNPRKSYHGPGATKRASPLIKKSASKNGVRPSARAMYDMGKTGPVYYDGARHVMAFRPNGSPYYKKTAFQCKDDV
tara:strand:- start:54 stop:392 length:339 start_codon:yes stop_codon:yes gene_type:complete